MKFLLASSFYIFLHCLVLITLKSAKMEPAFNLPSTRRAGTRLKNWFLVCSYNDVMKRHLELCYHRLEDPVFAACAIEKHVRYHVLQESPDLVYVHINYKKGISKNRLRLRLGGLPFIQMESLSKPLSFWRHVEANIPGVSHSFGTPPDYSKPLLVRRGRPRLSPRPDSPLTVPPVEDNPVQL